MGGLTLNTYLGLNPAIADRLAGVIYSAPYFGMNENMGVNFAKKAVVSACSEVLGEFVVIAPLAIHKVCRNKQYMRSVITQKKSVPLISLGLIDSFIKNHDRVMTYARQVKYPYLMVLGEKDSIINNKIDKEWHAMTSSKVKQFRLMPSAYHELTKEPNNHIMFDASLKFMAQRLQEAKPFGQFNIKDVKIAKKVPLYKRRRFWVLLLVLYLLIGLLVSIIRRQKRLFLSWPALLVIAKRLKP